MNYRVSLGQKCRYPQHGVAIESMAKDADRMRYVESQHFLMYIEIVH